MPVLPFSAAAGLPRILSETILFDRNDEPLPDDIDRQCLEHSRIRFHA